MIQDLAGATLVSNLVTVATFIRWQWKYLIQTRFSDRQTEREGWWSGLTFNLNQCNEI